MSEIETQYIEIENALQQARAQNEQLISSISSILITLDQAVRVTHWNPTAERILGIKVGDVIGRPLAECPMRLDKGRILKAIEECRSECRQIRVDDVPFQRPDGKDGFLGITMNPFGGEGDLGVLILAADITERKIMGNQLVQSQKLESIGQLAAGVAHEINNPLGFVSSNMTSLDEYRQDLAELIGKYLQFEECVGKNAVLSADHDLAGILKDVRGLRKRIDLEFVLDDLGKLIAESKKGTERVKKIVQDLKDFSNVDQAELKYVDINKGLDSTLNIASSQIKHKAEVIRDYGNVPEVCCYPQELNQVFMNILVNAAQAIEDKGEIRISTRSLSGSHPMVEIRISDTGRGIARENLSRIFDPFFTTKRVGQGTGLGLSMAYKIIKKHKGDIKVESETGKGAAFVITLPARGDQGH